jgi:peptidoglycan/xylan/chitin deacetylase (PgdA/CDA1 family)
VLQRILASGHEVGNHMCKDRPSWRLSAEKYEEKLIQCDQLLGGSGAFYHIPNEEDVSLYNANPPDRSKELDGEEMADKEEEGIKYFKWTRPGSGFFTSSMLETASRNGYSVALGSVYPHDPQIRLPALNGHHVVARTKPGSIIIIHDRPYTSPTLRHILSILTEREQYQFLTLSQLANWKHSGLVTTAPE